MASLFLSGLFDALVDTINSGIFGVLLGVLVDTLIGGFDHAENKLANIFINYQHARCMLPACTAALPHVVHAACMSRLLRGSVNARACIALRSARRRSLSSARSSLRSSGPDMWSQICDPRCVVPDVWSQMCGPSS